jgi:DNA polymerase III epsilon subunit-like protein
MSVAETFISVDVEAAGPFPGRFSLLTLGACLVDRPTETFEANFKPISMEADPKALEVTGLSLQALAAKGEDPAAAMLRFETWIAQVTPENGQPVFVGLNAAFDWAFVNHYFLELLGRNPFGFAALDIKALYMGAVGSAWSEARSSVMRRTLGAQLEGNHDALTDAVAQAELFRLIRSHGRETSA